MSSSGAVVSTRAVWGLPSWRRIVTSRLVSRTWTLVRIVSGWMKKPDPDPPLVPTRTTAGSELPITSSRDPAGAGAAGGVATAGIAGAGVATPASAGAVVGAGASTAGVV